MLQEVLGNIHNWFVKDIKKDEFTISNGTLDLSGLVQDGQYFRVVGSIFNDGLYVYPYSEFKDETFKGEIWALAVPQEVIDLAEDIEEWSRKNPDSAYVSESFGGYSYTKGTAADGQAAKWQDVFRRRLNRWRKMPGCW